MRHCRIVGIAALAAAFAVPFATALDKPRVFSLLDVENHNVAPIGGFDFNRAPVAGDQFAIQDTLYKWAGGKRGAKAGTLRGIGTFQTSFGRDFKSRATVLFVVQAYLPAGSFIVQGYGSINPNGPSRFEIPIIGGTGAYANARGFVKVRDLGDGNQGKSNLVVHLLP